MDNKQIQENPFDSRLELEKNCREDLARFSRNYGKAQKIDFSLSLLMYRRTFIESLRSVQDDINFVQNDVLQIFNSLLRDDLYEPAFNFIMRYHDQLIMLYNDLNSCLKTLQRCVEEEETVEEEAAE